MTQVDRRPAAAITMENWHTARTEPPLTGDEKAAVARLDAAMKTDPDLALFVQRAVRPQAVAFDAIDIEGADAPAMAAKSDACRRYLRAQLAAEQQYHARQAAEALPPTATTVPFGCICPHCGRNLLGESIVDVSRPGAGRTFFYTESDHQLVYDGAQFQGIHCLETNDGQEAS